METPEMQVSLEQLNTWPIVLRKGPICLQVPAFDGLGSISIAKIYIDFL